MKKLLFLLLLALTVTAVVASQYDLYIDNVTTYVQTSGYHPSSTSSAKIYGQCSGNCAAGTDCWDCWTYYYIGRIDPGIDLKTKFDVLGGGDMPPLYMDLGWNGSGGVAAHACYTIPN